MWIEFIGPPGVGKSTLRKNLLESTLVRQYTLEHGSWQFNGDVPEPMQRTYDKVLAIYEENCISEARMYRRMARFREQLFRVHKSIETDRVVVLDEAMAMAAQAASYDFAHKLPPVLAVAALLPLPSILIDCRAPSDVIVERNKERGMHGGHDRSGNALDVVSNSRHIAAMFSDRGCPVRHLNMDQPTRVLLGHVEEMLRCYV